MPKPFSVIPLELRTSMPKIIPLLLAALLGMLILVPVIPVVVAAGSVWTRSNFIVVKAGDTVGIDISLTVNPGTGVKMDGWSGDTYTLTVTGLPGGSTAKFYYGNVEIKSINVKEGETVTIKLNIVTSSTTVPGDYNVTFIAYSSLTGDTLSLPLTVRILPPESVERKISITPAYPRIQLEQGKSISCPITISNEGAYGEQLTLNAIIPQGWQGTFKTTSGVSGLNTIYLQAKTSTSIIFELTPTQYPELGEYSFTLSVSSVDGVVRASCDVKISVVPRTQPIFSCQFPMKVIQPGETVKFQVGLTNPTSVKQTFNVSVSDLPVNWQAKVKTSGGECIQVINVNPSETVTLIVEISTPTSVESGTYPIVLTAKSAWLFENSTLWVTVQSPPVTPAKIELKAFPPYLDTYGGSEAKFKIKVSNTGGTDALLNLTAEGLPSDYKVVFKDSTGQQITAIYVEAGQSKEFYVSVSTSQGRMEARSFTVYVFNAELREKVNLTLNIIGFYEIKLTNQNFYTSTNVGGEATYTLYVKNTGNMEVSNVKVAVRGSAPEGFTITIQPDSIRSLSINSEASFTIAIQTASNVNAGNYYIDFQVTSDQTGPLLFTLRVEVFQTTNWILYASIILVILVVALFLVYRIFGRR